MNPSKKLSVHYIFNETVLPLIEQYFRPSLPEEFEPVGHRTETWTSGNFWEDNFRTLMEYRTELIIREIESNLDGGLMLWSDVDIVFFSDCAEELNRLSDGTDLLFQKELADSTSMDCNFGFQLIRRNIRTLIFYSRLLLLQKATENGNEQSLGNWLLGFPGAPSWGHMPLTYSSESNGGCRTNSVLYHANCTAGDSLNKKHRQLNNAVRCYGRALSAPCGVT
jgi:Nucleotide-diphospho-sugar transferase.